MRINLFLFVLLLNLGNLNMQAQNHNIAVELSSKFDESQGRLVFNANNRDFCDYYVQIHFINAEGFAGMHDQTSVAVRRGEHQIRSYRLKEGATRISYIYRYLIVRGNPNKKPNIDFVYFLPASDKEAAIAKVLENRDGFQLEFDIMTDTIFASRGGVICNDDLTDHTAKGYRGFNIHRFASQITIYHSDGTFAEYVFRGRSLVYPGQHVEIGQAIAVFDQNMDINALRFSVYFLDKNKVSVETIDNKHTHFRPFFQTVETGRARLTDKGVYTSRMTNDMRMQDMSRQERRRFQQNR